MGKSAILLSLSLFIFCGIIAFLLGNKGFRRARFFSYLGTFGTIVALIFFIIVFKQITFSISLRFICIGLMLSLYVLQFEIKNGFNCSLVVKRD